MTGRTNQISFYVTDERKAELEERAAAQDDSISGVVNDMLDRQLQAEAQEAVASETRAEERIQELISLGVEEMAEAAQDIRDMNAKAGAYAIANFELLKEDHTNHVRKEALTTGMHRIRQDLDAVQELDVNGDGDGAAAGTDTGEAPTPDQGATAERDDGATPSPDSGPAHNQAGDPDAQASDDGGADSNTDTDTDVEDDDLFDQLRSNQP